MMSRETVDATLSLVYEYIDYAAIKPVCGSNTKLHRKKTFIKQ